MPFNGDDWYFTGAMRLPLPMWGIFNPIKVLPEVLEPLGGEVAAFIVYPMLQDYLLSVSIVQTLVISICIVMMLYQSYCFLKSRLNMAIPVALSLEVFFCLSFFWIFRAHGAASYYGFWALDLNCYFNYIIPGLLNASVVLYMERTSDFRLVYKGGVASSKGIFWTAVYFAIFSSIQLNIILAAYVLVKISVNVWKERKCLKKPSSWPDFLKENLIYAVIGLGWLISAIFEFNGKRADSLSTEGFFAQSFSETFRQMGVLSGWISGESRLALILVVILLAVFLWGNRLIRMSYLGLLGQFLMQFGIVLGYLFLLYSKAGGTYALRPDAMWAAIFYGLFIILLCVGMICTQRWVRIVLPLLILLIWIEVLNQNRRYQQGAYDYTLQKMIGDSIIQQVLEAEREGKDEVEVQVPTYANETNWPQPYNMGVWLQNTLYSHRLIKRRIKIVIVPDLSLTEKFGLNKGNVVDFVDFEKS